MDFESFASFLLMIVPQIQARKISADSSQIASTQTLPVVSRQRSNLPPVPLFNDVPNDRHSSAVIPEEETEAETVVIPATKLKVVEEVAEEIQMEEQETRDEEETRLEEETHDETPVTKAKERLVDSRSKFHMLIYIYD